MNGKGDAQPFEDADTLVDVRVRRRIPARSTHGGAQPDEAANEEASVPPPEAPAAEPLTADTLHAVHARHVRARRAGPRAASESGWSGFAGPGPAVTVLWIRSTAEGLRARRTQVDTVTLEGVATADGHLEVAVDDQRWRVEVRREDRAARVSRRLKRRLRHCFTLHVRCDGARCVVLFAGSSLDAER